MGISCARFAHHESIKHLFFNCHVAKFMWRVVQVTFNIDMPTSVAHLFNDWATGFGAQFKKLAPVGTAALCKALWTSRDDMVFDNSMMKIYM
jgi:hypothetical protein